MSIQSQVNELKSIQNEMASMRKRASFLRKRSKQLEQEIDAYLDSKDQPGLIFRGMAIIRETKPKRKIKKISEQKIDAINVLERHGIGHPEKVLEEILEARRGSPTEQRKLKFKKYKKKTAEEY